jgi:DNA repair exonuclease SbcCD ATPase subunit
MVRDLLASPLGPNSGFAHDYARLEDVPVVDALPPPASSHSDPPLQQQPSSSSSSLVKPAGVNGWLGLASTLFKGGETEEERLRKQMREYEQRLTDMRELAIRQARDITSLRTMAEQQIVQASEVGSARDEERWKRMLQDATQTQQQALIEGQRTMHELAASLQEAQRQAAQQQAHEWRAALLQASQEHAMVVEQLQAQLKTSEEKQLTLQAHLRDARRASAVAAAAAIANGKAGGANGEALEQAVERAVNAEREAAIARVSAAEDATERCLDTECSAARASQAEAACIQRQLTEKNRATQAQLTEMKGHSSSSRPPTWPSCRRHCERHDSRPRQRWRACGLRSDRSERSSFRSRRRR